MSSNHASPAGSPAAGRAHLAGSPGRVQRPSNDSQHSATNYLPDERGSEQEHPSQLQSQFESRGNLDTLAAAALKPLADSPRREVSNMASFPTLPAPQKAHSSRYQSASRSTMSISSLLGDTPSTSTFLHSAPDRDDSTPDHHASTQESFGRWREGGKEGGMSEDEVRPQSRSDESDSDGRHQEIQHSRHLQPVQRRSHSSQGGSEVEDASTEQEEQYLQHQHQHVHEQDNVQYHHHHGHPSQQQQHISSLRRRTHTLLHPNHHHMPHVHHIHQHSPLPHHHHHVHHHHLHHARSSSSGPSAFSYMPKSLGLRLNPKLKVNATQVYISYLIQLDQMQRAQHLMRSSEKRNPSLDITRQTEKTAHPRDKRAEENASDDVEREQSMHATGFQEETAPRNADRLHSPTASRATGDSDMDFAESAQPISVSEMSDRGSPTTTQQERVPPHTHIHAPSQKHSHIHAHGHTHGHTHAHAHTHPHHSAPVLPAHIHPAQHHHHMVPSATKLERGASKGSGTQGVHRHHTLHHHHPHHHPYHPNHPNHQHHFHHHGHTAGGAHNHNHAAHTHGHVHNHAVHVHGHAAHVHGHAHTVHAHHSHNGHNHTHTHATHARSPSSTTSLSPSAQRKSPILERTNRTSQQPLALPPAPNRACSVARSRSCKSSSPDPRRDVEHRTPIPPPLQDHHDQQGTKNIEQDMDLSAPKDGDSARSRENASTILSSTRSAQQEGTMSVD